MSENGRCAENANIRRMSGVDYDRNETANYKAHGGPA